MYPKTKTLLIAVVCLAPHVAWGQHQGRTSVVSLDAGGSRANSNSARPTLSGDGRYVAFESNATDLVPGDTNRTDDVFVRDHLTGVTERVSLTWKGQEARGKSACPAISFDGRYVAYRSNAWNLHPGRTNGGITRFDVYLVDRHDGTTTRVSAAPDGQEPLRDSQCPSISADGSRVAFASHADNLSEEDDNASLDVYVWDRDSGDLTLVSVDTATGRAATGATPAISGDGRFVAFSSGARLTPDARPNDSALVYVRDLDAGVTTVSSRHPRLSHGRLAPGDNRFPTISFDGRFVAFLSRSETYEDIPYGKTQDNVVVHDREAGTWTGAGPVRPVGVCGSPSRPFACRVYTVGPPAMSADGRYVAYSTRSTHLLPAAYSSGDQIHVFDRHTGRLRRISVGPRGITGDSCSVEPAISADGSVVAYRSSSGNIAGDNGTVHDVFRSQWRCHDEGCNTASMCPTSPRQCEPAQSSTLRLTRHPPGGRHPDRFFWKWIGPTLDGSAPFGDPTADTRYELCVYAGEFMDLEHGIAAGDPWQSNPSGYSLTDPAAGIKAMILRNTAQRSMIIAHGRGKVLDAPHLPLPARTGVTVRLHDVAAGRCWEADFPTSAIEQNDAGLAGARQGRFVAKLP